MNALFFITTSNIKKTQVLNWINLTKSATLAAKCKENFMQTTIFVMIFFYGLFGACICNAGLPPEQQIIFNSYQPQFENLSSLKSSFTDKDSESLNFKSTFSNKDFVIEKLISILESKNSDNSGSNYYAWVSILLGCIGVIITIFSVVVAIVSFIGYRNFEKKIEITVKTISSKVAAQEAVKQLDVITKKELVRLINDGALNKHLEDAVSIVFLRSDNSNKDAGFKKYPEIDEEELHS